MSTPTPVSGLIIPENTDILNAEASYGQFASSVDTVLIPRYASETARDAAMVGGAAEGQLCVVGSPSSNLQRFDGSGWQQVEERQWANLTANQTVSTTTFVNMTGLSWTCAANATYRIEFSLSLDSSVTASTCDFQVGFTYTGALATNVSTFATFAPAASATSRSSATASVLSTQANPGAGPLGVGVVGSGLGTAAYYVVQFTTTSAGVWQLQGRQFAAAADTVTIQSLGTFANMRRIA